MIVKEGIGFRGLGFGDKVLGIRFWIPRLRFAALGMTGWVGAAFRMTGWVDAALGMTVGGRNDEVGLGMMVESASPEL